MKFEHIAQGSPWGLAERRGRYAENKKLQLHIITECNIKAHILPAVLSRLGFIKELSWSLLEKQEMVRITELGAY